MLSDQQIGHFQAFGFVVLRGLLAPARTAALRAEVDAALRDAYAATYHERVSGGISGHYLPMASRLTPVSAGLVCDDPLLPSAAASCPGYAAATWPGDVIAFGFHVWHGTFGGRDRLAWRIDYQQVPGKVTERERALRWMADDFDQGPASSITTGTRSGGTGPPTRPATPAGRQ